jgi:protein-tyrosine phosphatase
MGYPAVLCETLIRNSLFSVKKLFSQYHQNNVKIYNLCMEQDRIYNKEIFGEIKVGLFPAQDHSACQIKLILEFCVDMSIHLLENESTVGAVHCKAGKGRTGLMICCFLVFSGICKDSNTALEEYAKRRSHVKKGVTISSQKRYIHHFETFLKCNFTQPYYKMVPKIVSSFLNPGTNLLYNVLRDKYFNEFINIFKINKIKVGPIKNQRLLNFVISNIKNQIKFDSSRSLEKTNFTFFIKEKINSNKIQETYAILVS